MGEGASEAEQDGVNGIDSETAARKSWVFAPLSVVGRTWSSLPTLAKGVLVLAAGAILVATGALLRSGQINNLRTEEAQQAARAKTLDASLAASYKDSSDKAIQVTALQKTVTGDESLLTAAKATITDLQAQLAAANAKVADMTKQLQSSGSSSTSSAPSASTGPSVDLNSPLTLRNPSPSVGGLACELQNSGFSKALGSAKCVWNGIVWMPTNP